MLKQYFSTFIDSLSDDESRISMRGDMLSSAHYSYFNGYFDGVSEFDAVCLVGAPEGYQERVFAKPLGAYYPIRVRPLNVHGFILPDPCADVYKNNIQMLGNLINNHPLAFADRPIGFEERVPQFGDVLQCRMLYSPKQNGKIRGIRYLYPKKQHSYNYNCANNHLQSYVGNLFDGPTTSLVEEKVTTTPSGKIPKYYREFDFDKRYKFWYDGWTYKDGKKNKPRGVKPQYEERYAAIYDAYDHLFKKYGNQYGLEPSYLKAICWIESKMDKDAVSSVGAYGLMQFMPDTAKMPLVGGSDTAPFDRSDPEKSVEAAAKLLVWIMKKPYIKNSENPHLLALAAYNAGWGATWQYKTTTDGKSEGRVPPYTQTEEYVAKGKAAWDYFKNEKKFK
mgnify:CR=1 FL=1|tara:strand:+ start:10707 stop:11882 length:1176 start_codon:yes stop_codon:yes gene_type:complete